MATGREIYYLLQGTTPGCNVGLCQETVTALKAGTQITLLFTLSVTSLSRVLLSHVRFAAASEGTMV